MGIQRSKALLVLILFSVLLVGYRIPLKIQNSPLPTMKPFAEMELELGKEVTCSNVMPRLEKQYAYWKLLYENFSLMTSDYSHVTGVWHSSLSKFEEVESPIGEGFFLPLTNSSAAMQQTLGFWDDVTEEIRNDYITVLEVLPECLIADGSMELTEDDERLYKNLEKFIDMSYDFDSTVSSFVGQMQQLVDMWYSELSPFEGQKVVFKKDRFHVMDAASKDFKEAAVLMEGNKQYLLDSFEDLIQQVQSRLSLQKLANHNN